MYYFIKIHGDLTYGREKPTIEDKCDDYMNAGVVHYRSNARTKQMIQITADSRSRWRNSIPYNIDEDAAVQSRGDGYYYYYYYHYYYILIFVL